MRLPQTLPDGRPWPRITVVTPSFNQGRFIEETILSVLNQDYPNVEHFIIDGGSIDDTLQVLDRYRDRLALVISESDTGQGNAINKGFRRATGEILTWLNSDDMLAPGALAAVAMAFATNSADLISGICTLHENGQVIGHHLTACPDGPLPLDELLDLEGAWLVGEFFYQPEVFFSRALWERAGSYVEESLYYSLDYDLWVRFAEVGGMLHAVGRPLALYRVHPEQKTYGGKFLAELEACRRAHVARIGRNPTFRRRKAEFSRKLRVALLNDIGERYGAGIAHGRIAEGIRRAGHEVHWAYFGQTGPGVPTQSDSARLRQWLASVKPDLAIVGNLHGAGANPLLMSIVAEVCPTLWILHDFWPITGRCAYTAGCLKYKVGCDHTCPTPDEYPALHPDEIEESWVVKRAVLSAEQAPMLLAYSASAAAFARGAFETTATSQVIAPKIEEFRLGIPVERYRVRGRRECREKLGLPLDRFIILFGAASASDKRKGGEHLFEVLKRFRDLPVTCCVVGMWDDSVVLPGIDIRKLGFVSDPEQLALAYAAADVFVGPSLEETLGQVFIEAAACGTPAVGYPVTGVKDAIRDGVTGRLATGVGADHLEAAILDLYGKPDLRADLGVWGPLFVANEWSIEAGYRHLFVALRRLDILDRFNVPHRIHFSSVQPAKSPPASLRQSPWTPGGGFGDREGPHSQFNQLVPFHWCAGPVSELKLNCQITGRYVFIIEYQNILFPMQELVISIDNEFIGKYTLGCTKAPVTRIFVFTANLTAGEHDIFFEFSRWYEATPAEPRKIALIINNFHYYRLP